MNVTARHNDGSELQFDAKIFEGDCNGRESLTGLDQRKWKLAASQETGFFTVDRDQIRLGQDLKQVLRLQCLNNGSEVNIRPEKKKVQNVIDSFAACGLTYLLSSESSELTRGGCPNRICSASGDEISAQLCKCAAVYLGEFHLKQNLLSAHRAKGKYIDHVLGVGSGEFGRTFGHIFGGNVSREHDSGARRRYRDLFVGKDAMFFFRASADVYVDAEVEAT